LVLVEEPEDLSTRLLPPCLFVSHNPVGRGEDNVSELARWKKVDNPLLNLVLGNVEPGGDDPALVEAAIQFDHDLGRTVIIDDLEFADVA